MNKIDLAQSLDEIEAAIRPYRDLGVAIYLTSAERGDGLEDLRDLLTGKISVLAGLSGVGKSSLLTAVQPDFNLRVGEVSHNTLMGRHTTTHRELFLIPGRGMVIDNPGMRELQLWAREQTVGDTFAEIEALAEDCRFSDCSHGGEPGCAVQQRIDAGKLDPKRLQSYLKQKRELEQFSQTEPLNGEERYKLRRRQGRLWEREIRGRFKDKY